MSIEKYISMEDYSLSGVYDEQSFNSLYPKIVGVYSRGGEFSRLFSSRRNSNLLSSIVQSSTSSSFSRIRNKWYSTCFLNVFTPSKLLQATINKYLVMFRQKYVIGVNIDMAYLERSMSASDAMNRVQKRFWMLDEMLKKETAVLFVMTDSEDVETMLRNKYGERVIALSELPRYTQKQVSEASLRRFFIELMLLGRTQSLILTQGSKISETALYFHFISPRVYYI